MGLLKLFITASVPVLNVLLLTGVGSISATRHVGILGQDARKHLNNVVFFIFNPALVASNLSKTITLESMVLLWFMPVNLLLNSIIGSALGWVIIKITKAPAHLKGVILSSCSAGNVGNLFLILVPAICKEKGSHLGSPDVCDTYGLAYASLSMAICTILQWWYVYNIVRMSSNPEESRMNEQPQRMQFPEESKKFLPHCCTPETLSTSGCLISDPTSNEHMPILFEPEESIAKLKVPIVDKVKVLTRRFPGTIDFKKIFAPSTIGVIVGFIIGIIPQVKQAIVGKNAPLRMIQDAASLLGNGTVPSLILITGGNLTKGLHGPGVKFSLILGVTLVRFIALPILGTTIVQQAIRLGLVHSDPLYRFTLLLQHAVPPAMNIASMIQMFEAGEGELSVILLWTYGVASVALTTWMTFFMWLVS